VLFFDFINPNDRFDVIMVVRIKEENVTTRNILQLSFALG